VCETQRDRTVILLRDHAVGIFQVKDTIYTTREMPASKFSRTVSFLSCTWKLPTARHSRDRALFTRSNTTFSLTRSDRV
jgi:hypothetical protein